MVRVSVLEYADLVQQGRLPHNDNLENVWSKTVLYFANAISNPSDGLTFTVMDFCQDRNGASAWNYVRSSGCSSKAKTFYSFRTLAQRAR